MAQLPPDTTETINRLKQQCLDIVDEATAGEFNLLAIFGETDETLQFFHEIKTVAEDATASFSRLSNLQLRIAESQPNPPFDMLELLSRAISQTQARIPAWSRSIEEVKIEWNLP